MVQHGEEQRSLVKTLRLRQLIMLDDVLKESYPVPDKTFIIDVPVGEAMKRIEQRGEKTIIESRGRLYFNDVRRAYQSFVKGVLDEAFDEVILIDGTGTVEQITSDILSHMGM